ncbi:MAG: preprotein translocase subunit SecG [Parcubacteria group bacterium]|nr:preprotein translocase subunit SecG [Parcubacteria group bacterium]
MLAILQIIFAILLVTVILMQRKGTGLGAAFGGGGAVRYQKRGAEKVLHTATIIIAVIFVGLLAANLFIA